MSKFKHPIAMLILSAFALTMGLWLGVAVECKWFGNFGALVVLSGVASEYSLLQLELSTLYSALKGQGATVAGNTGIPDLKPSSMHKRLAHLSHTAIVLGTFIWGFGEWALCCVLQSV